jgi:hypothetical protein
MSKAQKDAVKKMAPSAYRSMLMARLNMTEKTPKKSKDLERWIDEEWKNLNSLLVGLDLPCGKKYKGQTDKTVCRPKIKVSKSTPQPLAYDLTEKQIRKAIKQKNEGKRINWSKL